MKKIIFSTLLIILVLTWVNRLQQFAPKIVQTKQKIPLIKSPLLKTEPTRKVSIKLPDKAIIVNYQCQGKTICSQMNSCKEAIFYLKNCSIKRLDRDKDGIPCEKRWCN